MSEPELIFQSGAQELLDNLVNVLKISAVFFTETGFVLSRGGRRQGICRFCSLLQKRYGMLEKCKALDARYQAYCRKKPGWYCYKCHGGLTEILAPVMADRRIAGYILFGQFRTVRKIPVDLLSAAKGKKARQELEKAFLQVPFFAAEDMNDLMSLLKKMVDYIASHELVSLKGGEMIASVKQLIDLHYRDPDFNQKTCAQYLNRSVSCISHALSAGGGAFRKMLNVRRLEAAESLLKREPDLPLKIAAEFAGFRDPCYFARIYRKYRGGTIGVFRKKFTIHD